MELAFLLFNITRLLADRALFARILLFFVVIKTLNIAHCPRTSEVKVRPAGEFQTYHVLRDASHCVCEILHVLTWEQRLSAILI